MLVLDFTNETEAELEESLFSGLAEKGYEILKDRIDSMMGKRNGGIDLVLVDDPTIHKLNKEYRDKDKPTDVISFAYLEVTEYEKVEGDIIVGDVFISVDTAKKQAKKKGHSLEEELSVLFVHGFLHLFGFDHQDDEEEEEMEGWASKILEA